MNLLKKNAHGTLRLLIMVFVALIWVMLPRQPLSAQDHSQDAHDHGRHKIAAAPGMVYLSAKEKWAPGLHVKYAYGFHIGSLHAGIGIVGDVIFTDHDPHYGVGLSFGLEPFKSLHIHFGPMLSFDHGETELNASIGVAYPIKFGHLRIGPVTEIAFNAHEYHWMTGVVFMLPF